MENKSGWIPVGTKIIVKPDPIEEKTKGGIIFVDETMTKERMMNAKGVIVDVGGTAYTEIGANWTGIIPKPGDRVLFAVHAGSQIKGDDGEDYRIMHDEDVCCVEALNV